MQIVQKKVSELIPYEKNPRKNDSAVEMVAKSIKEFGFKVPIVIDKNNVIVAGHTRYKASQRLGLKEVPCIVADDLTDEQIKAYRLADNKVGEYAEWDDELLSEELSNIFDIDMSDFGFDLKEAVSNDEDEPLYVSTVNIPQYEPTGRNVDIKDLINTSKRDSLIKRIQESSVDESQKAFLIASAYRHNVFDYKAIAEYYAQTSEEMQELMEESALVIIDMSDAIANGYAVLRNSVEEMVFGEDGEN